VGFYAKREGYKAPDIKAPRFRRQRLSVLNPELFKKFRQENPGIDIDFKTFKRIILSFNRKVRDMVIEHRDGVELPEQIGYLFIGTCPRKSKTLNTDPLLSAENEKNINYKNWDSNQYVCKIFYSNYGTKYRFANRHLWFFTPCRTFKRSVSKAYRVNWNKYIKISPISKISSFFRSQGIKTIKVQKYDYKNRRVDFSGTQPD